VENIGEIIRRLREDKGEPLRRVAAYLDIDQAVLSKIERGQRKASKELVGKLAEYFGADKKEMLIAWLSDRIMYAIEDEELGEEALKVAEEQIAYEKFNKVGRVTILRKIKQFFQDDGRVNRAWIFGSFARNDDKPGSDIDLMIEEIPNEKFSYFDLADIQYRLEIVLERKTDIGFASTLREEVAENIRQEAQLIYENQK
jgi:predicted nucleotidyltransferase/plasmid maintenance system antidote protein VapI